jgi:hypothetical protein
MRRRGLSLYQCDRERDHRAVNVCVANHSSATAPAVPELPAVACAPGPVALPDAE